MLSPIVSDDSRPDFLKVPGLLSLSRVPLAVLFCFVVQDSFVAVAVLALAGVSDVMDGWYARRFHQETPTGRILDPVADKIFVAAVVLSMVRASLLSALEASLLVTREIGELLLLLLYWLIWPRTRHRPARAANRWGKVATAMQFSTVALLLVGGWHRREWILATAICGVLATMSYAIRELRPGQP